MAVSASQTFTMAVGDTTRTNLLASGSWTAGAGWSVSGGTATHTLGAAGNLTRPITTVTGRWYRVGFTVSAARRVI